MSDAIRSRDCNRRCKSPCVSGVGAPDRANRQRGRREGTGDGSAVAYATVGCSRGRAAVRRPTDLAIMTHGTVASRPNLEVIEDAYQRWRRDPASVDESWRWFFEGFELAAARPDGGAAPDAARWQTGVVRLIYAYRE